MFGLSSLIEILFLLDKLVNMELSFAAFLCILADPSILGRTK
jgi:hypothetical protein